MEKSKIGIEKNISMAIKYKIKKKYCDVFKKYKLLKYDYLFDRKKEHIRKKDKKEIYYIIRRKPPGAGFCSNYLYILGHVVWGLEEGMIPVVDMQTYETLYSSQLNKDAWYCYFKKDEKLPSLKEIYRKENYVLSEDRYLWEYSSKYCGNYNFPTPGSVEYYAPYIKQFFALNSEIENEFEQRFDVLVKGRCVLGVHIRGTDMNNTPEHPIPQAVEKFANKVKEILQEHSDIQCIFLATDEQNTIQFFESLFKDKLCFLDAYRSKQNDKIGIHMQKNGRKNNGYWLGIEVLMDMFFLSKCDYLLCGDSNVSTVAILNNMSKYQEIYHLPGIYK